MTEPPVSKRTYLFNTIALLLLLGLAMLVDALPLGVLTPLLTLGIAAAKAFLVAWFFMHLNIAKPITRVFAIAAIMWLIILIGLTLTDTTTRGWIKGVGSGPPERVHRTTPHPTNPGLATPDRLTHPHPSTPLPSRL